MKHATEILKAIKFLDAIGDRITYKRIQDQTGATSTSHIARTLAYLEEKGRIVRKHGVIVEIN